MVKKKIIFINSHPIQYFAPLYKYINDQEIEVEAWYCSDESIKGGYDSEFGVDVKWDIPLLQGYKYKFFKNNSWKPSHSKGFFGLINLGMILQLFKEPKSVIIVHGWNYFTHLFILILGRLKGHTVCLRNDMPQKQEINKKGWKQVIKKIGLKYILFPRVNYFLYIGTQNRLLYKSYNLEDSRLIACPYTVDNSRFRKEAEKLKPFILSIKERLGIKAEDKIIIFSAKYIEKKRPLDLLHAFIKLNDPKCWLIMIGEGELRKEMEKTIKEKQLKNVILTGFVNQSQISEYYVIGDVFVMCSSFGENWGLSANEAMNFNLPLVLSDLTGCSDDLVKNGTNGYVFKTGRVDELAEKLNCILKHNKLDWSTTSEKIVDEYSHSSVLNNLKELL